MKTGDEGAVDIPIDNDGIPTGGFLGRIRRGNSWTVAHEKLGAKIPVGDARHKWQLCLE